MTAPNRCRGDATHATFRVDSDRAVDRGGGGRRFGGGGRKDFIVICERHRCCTQTVALWDAPSGHSGSSGELSYLRNGADADRSLGRFLAAPGRHDRTGDRSEHGGPDGGGEAG